MWQMKRVIPQETVELENLINNLPLNDSSPTKPYASLVLNCSVATKPHRDTGDFSCCLVVPFGEWQGGMLILYEPGLILILEDGQPCWFNSRKITHFNADMKGIRGSLVFHTDYGLQGWEKNRYDQDVVI